MFEAGGRNERRGDVHGLHNLQRLRLRGVINPQEFHKRHRLRCLHKVLASRMRHHPHRHIFHIRRRAMQNSLDLRVALCLFHDREMHAMEPGEVREGVDREWLLRVVSGRLLERMVQRHESQLQPRAHAGDVRVDDALLLHRSRDSLEWI